MTGPRLLADIGGTNIRLAWQAQSHAPLRDVRVLRCAEHPTLLEAVKTYLSAMGAPAPSVAAFGVATPVCGDEVRMTNHSWTFSQAALRKALGLRRLLVINDFTALAFALPYLCPGVLRQVGGERPEAGAPMVLLGPGTGLGVSGLVFPEGGGQGIPVAGEGGHGTLAAENAMEFDVLSLIQQWHGHASAERVLSGPGLVNIYRALCRLKARMPEDEVAQPAEVTERALMWQEPQALQALQMFCGFLGSVAGNLALTLGGRGGVFLAGGIVARLGSWFEQSAFRSRFESKGRLRPYLAPIPCWVIDPAAQSALLGVSHALDRP